MTSSRARRPKWEFPLASNPELLAAYAQLENNPFWVEYRKRLTSLRDAAVATTLTTVPVDDAGVWGLARTQGAYSAFRTALSLPESMIGPRATEGK